MSDTKYRLDIRIDGDSAKELFAVGVEDLIWFLGEKLNVKKEDIKYCVFEEDLNEDEFADYLLGKRSRKKHKDNYIRREKNA